MEVGDLACAIDDEANIGRAVGLVMEQYDVTSGQALDALLRCVERVPDNLAEVAGVLITMMEETL